MDLHLIIESAGMKAEKFGPIDARITCRKRVSQYKNGMVGWNVLFVEDHGVGDVAVIKEITV